MAIENLNIHLINSNSKLIGHNFEYGLLKDNPLLVSFIGMVYDEKI
jgi:hypothetical protein